MNDITHAARLAHETIRAIQGCYGDPDPSPAWEVAPEWMRASTTAGVYRVLNGMSAPELHAAWMRDRVDHGWTYGPIKSTADRVHPSLVDWDDLSEQEKIKDILFVAVVSNAIDTATVSPHPTPNSAAHDHDAAELDAHRAGIIPPRYATATTASPGVLSWMRGVSSDQTRRAIVTGPIWSGKTHAMYAAVGALISSGQYPGSISIHDAYDVANGEQIRAEPVVIVDNVTYRIDNHIPSRPRPVDPHDEADLALLRHHNRGRLIDALTGLLSNHSTSWMIIGSSRTAFEACIGEDLTERMYQAADHVIVMPPRPNSALDSIKDDR